MFAVVGLEPTENERELSCPRHWVRSVRALSFRAPFPRVLVVVNDSEGRRNLPRRWTVFGFGIVRAALTWGYPESRPVPAKMFCRARAPPRSLIHVPRSRVHERPRGSLPVAADPGSATGLVGRRRAGRRTTAALGASTTRGRSHRPRPSRSGCRQSITFGSVKNVAKKNWIQKTGCPGRKCLKSFQH